MNKVYKNIDDFVKWSPLYERTWNNDNGDCDIIHQLILANNTDWLEIINKPTEQLYRFIRYKRFT